MGGDIGITKQRRDEMKTYKVELRVARVEYRTIQAESAQDAMIKVEAQVDGEGLYADVTGARLIKEGKTK